MNKSKSFSLLLACLVASLFASQALWAQRVSIVVHATDHYSTDADSVIIGNDPAASNQIDDGTNGTTNLGEEELPVETPTFDFRTVSISSGVGRDTCLKGLKLNLHHQARVTQDDRWRLQFQSDSQGTAVTFSWDQAAVAAAGGQGWRLENAAGVPYCDMTTQDNFTFPTNSLDPQFIFVHTYDSYEMRSIEHDSLALSQDVTNPAKPKISGKGTKRKNYQSDWIFTITNGTDSTCTSILVSFGQALVGDLSGFTGFSPWPTASSLDKPGKMKKWTFSGASIPPGGSFVVGGKGWGSKANTAKIQWYAGAVKVKPGTSTVTLKSSTLRLPMPSYWNMVEELYAQGAFPAQLLGKPIGLYVGKLDPVRQDAGKNVFKDVIHAKPGDLFKTLYNKKVANFVHTGPADCLNLFTDGSGKEIKTTQKTLPPTKMNNVLLAEAIAMKINIEASDYNKTPAGFGDLVYNGGGPFQGMSVRNISLKLDTVLSCGDPVTPADAYAAAHAINVAFSGKIDTESFGSGSKVPPPAGGGATVLTGVRAVGSQSVLYRPTATNPPAVLPSPYREYVEAPSKFALSQNYPNPFNPTTTIEFTLQTDAFVTLKIYNVLGQEVATLLNHEEMTGGDNDVQFDASNLASGAYYYRIVVENLNDDGVGTGKTLTQVKKMMLIK